MDRDAVTKNSRSSRTGVSAAEARRPSAAGASRRWSIAVAAALVLAAGGGVAWWYGNQQPQTAIAPPAATTPADPALAEQATEISRQLETAPKDAALWQSLARTYVLQGRFADAVPAYKSAIDNGADSAAVHSAYGEAQVMAASGEVTEPALAAFQAALAKDRAEPRARYYAALADAQDGKLHEALDAWIKLEADSPAEAPWRKSLTERIDQTANTLGLDPQKLPGRGGAAFAGEPSMADLNAAARRPAAEREALLGEKTKVLAARLSQGAGEPRDWTILAQAYKLLGDHEQSLSAWKQAAALAPDEEGVLIHYAEAILAVRSEGQKLPPEFTDLARRIRSLDPQNLEGLFFAGLAEQDAGNVEGARAIWRQLLQELPADSPQRTDIQARLDALADGG
jgi:cytochrome c-type biogenesis protein CcmH